MNKRGAKHTSLRISVYLRAAFDPDLLLLVVFGGICCATKARFRGSGWPCMLMKTFFSRVGVGQTCALRSLKSAHKTLRLLRPNRQKLKCPGARFLLQEAVNKLLCGKMSSVSIPRTSLQKTVTGYFLESIFLYKVSAKEIMCKCNFFENILKERTKKLLQLFKRRRFSF